MKWLWNEPLSKLKYHIYEHILEKLLAAFIGERENIFKKKIKKVDFGSKYIPIPIYVFTCKKTKINLHTCAPSINIK